MSAEAPQLKRAVQVCRSCKQRKKACDKVLPVCGHCSKRGLECRYSDEAARIQKDPILVGSVAATLASSPGPSLDGNMNLQVCHVIHRTGVSIPQLASRYFRDFHQWLPVISPSTFQNMATRYQHGVPPADFSMLLLCMYLIVLRPADESTAVTRDPLQPRDLYNTVKLFFGYVQGHLCSSFNLAQSCILVTSYEYACGKIRDAYVTIGHTLRLGYVLELQHSIRTNSFHQGLHLSHSRAEQRNLWWGIIVMERLIVLEMPSKGMALSTRYPLDEFQYPGDLVVEEATTHSLLDDDEHRVHKDHFANVAKACFYLDAVLMAVESRGVSDALLELDAQIVKFMHVAMQLDTHAPHSDTLTIATRSLMLRHQVLLDRLPEGDVKQRKKTEDALDSTATMILEAATDHHHHLHDVDSLSLSCGYCLDIAVQRYDSQAHLQQNRHLAPGVDAARRLVQVFRERWPAP